MGKVAVSSSLGGDDHHRGLRFSFKGRSFVEKVIVAVVVFLAQPRSPPRLASSVPSPIHHSPSRFSNPGPSGPWDSSWANERRSGPPREHLGHDQIRERLVILVPLGNRFHSCVAICRNDGGSELRAVDAAPSEAVEDGKIVRCPLGLGDLHRLRQFPMSLESQAREVGQAVVRQGGRALRTVSLLGVSSTGQSRRISASSPSPSTCWRRAKFSRWPRSSKNSSRAGMAFVPSTSTRLPECSQAATRTAPRICPVSLIMSLNWAHPWRGHDDYDPSFGQGLDKRRQGIDGAPGIYSP